MRFSTTLLALFAALMVVMMFISSTLMSAAMVEEEFDDQQIESFLADLMDLAEEDFIVQSDMTRFRDIFGRECYSVGGLGYASRYYGSLDDCTKTCNSIKGVKSMFYVPYAMGGMTR